jgi:hypothetical protein
LEGDFHLWSPLEGLLLLTEFGQWFCNLGEIGNKQPVIMQRPRKLLISCLFFGVGHTRMDFSFSGSVVITSGDTICSRYRTSFCNR